MWKLYFELFVTLYIGLKLLLFWFAGSDVICTESGTGRLMFAVAGGDYDEVVTLSSRVMKKAKSLDLSTSLTDAHLYVMKRWLLDYALTKE